MTKQNFESGDKLKSVEKKKETQKNTRNFTEIISRMGMNLLQGHCSDFFFLNFAGLNIQITLFDVVKNQRRIF